MNTAGRDFSAAPEPGQHFSSGLAEDWVDRLVPPEPDDELERLLNLTVVDGQERFQPGPIDQALIGAVTWFVRQPVATSAEHALVVRLPRGSHDVAMYLGLIVQALRLNAAQKPTRRGSPEAFTGSVVVTAMDTAVQARMRALQVPGAQLKGLAEALRVYRLRADGRLVSPISATIPHRPDRQRMIYHNVRVGWPTLQTERDGLGVIDATTLRSSEILTRAFDWGQRHGIRRWLVLGDLGLDAVEQVLGNRAIPTTTVPFTPEVVRDLHETLGPGTAETRLSCDALSPMVGRSLGVEICAAPELDQYLRRAHGMLAEARRVSEKLPHQLVSVARLVAGVSRCADRVDSYNRAAVSDPRSMSLRAITQVLRRRGDALRAGDRWHVFAQTTWASLRSVAIKAYELLESEAPKYHHLVNVLDVCMRESPDVRIRIRTANRAGAIALANTLTAERTAWMESGRIDISAWSERAPWARAPITEILVAVPPRYRNDLLYGAESHGRIVLAYPSEVPLLNASYARELERRAAQLAGSFQRLMLGSPPKVEPSWQLPRVSFIDDNRASTQLDVNLERALLSGAALVADAPEDDVAAGSGARPSDSAIEGELEVLPVTLSSGSVWWLTPSSTVEVLVGERYHHRLASQLAPEDAVIVPRGEGREALFSRLVTAAHRGADTTTLDLLLGRFRRACLQAYEDAGRNWAELRRQLQRTGCTATSQARSWADGSTIAPQDPEDVRRVAELVRFDDLRTNWHRVSSIAHELRSLHIRLGHLISGALTELAAGGGPNLQQVEELLGDNAEILDEFVIDAVLQVGAPEWRPASYLGAFHDA